MLIGKTGMDDQLSTPLILDRCLSMSFIQFGYLLENTFKVLGLTILIPFSRPSALRGIGSDGET